MEAFATASRVHSLLIVSPSSFPLPLMGEGQKEVGLWPDQDVQLTLKSRRAQLKCSEPLKPHPSFPMSDAFRSALGSDALNIRRALCERSELVRALFCVRPI
jgi:hypothetical protein